MKVSPRNPFGSSQDELVHKAHVRDGPFYFAGRGKWGSGQLPKNYPCTAKVEENKFMHSKPKVRLHKLQMKEKLLTKHSRKILKLRNIAQLPSPTKNKILRVLI